MNTKYAFFKMVFCFGDLVLWKSDYGKLSELLMCVDDRTFISIDPRWFGEIIIPPATNLTLIQSVTADSDT